VLNVQIVHVVLVEREILLSSNTNLLSDCFLKSLVNGCSFVWVVGKYCCHQTTIDSLLFLKEKTILS
jgi:hypothetical protein